MKEKKKFITRNANNIFKSEARKICLKVEKKKGNKDIKKHEQIIGEKKKERTKTKGIIYFMPVALLLPS